jgi:peroxiredoxin
MSLTRRQFFRHSAWGLACVAATASGYWFWHRQSGGAQSLPTPDTLWQQEFATIDGQLIRMASFKGKPLLINFWASWCPPCVAEMPEINRYFHWAQALGGQVLGLAVDNPTAVRTFLHKTPVEFPIALAGFEGSELSKTLGSATGALPYSVMIDASGLIRYSRSGKTHLAELQTWFQAIQG